MGIVAWIVLGLAECWEYPAPARMGAPVNGPI